MMSIDDGINSWDTINKYSKNILKYSELNDIKAKREMETFGMKIKKDIKD